MKKNEIVIKIIQTPVGRTASIERIKEVKKKVAYLGEGREPDDVSAYNAETGEAMQSYIPGCRSYIVPLDADEESKIVQELVE